MKFYYITFRSVTYAQQGEQQLQKAGLRSFLLRTPKWMEQQGCGYCLRLWTSDIAPAVRILQQGQVPFRKVYVGGRDGQLEDWIP